MAHINIPWIQHFSRADIANGTHYHPLDNTILIQIRGGDDDLGFPTPLYSFREIHKFEFEDVESVAAANHISDEQAQQLATILRNAYANQLNVLVHCYAGLCRSSAVAIAGKAIGFRLDDKIRLPNKLVQRKLLKALGLLNDTVIDYFPGTDIPIYDPYNILDRREDGDI